MAVLQFNKQDSWTAFQKAGVSYWISYPNYGTTGDAQYNAVKTDANSATLQTDLGLYANYNAAAKACQDDAIANP